MKKFSNILVVGDLHTKFHIFEKVKEIAESYDRIIFLGDYVDDWGAPPEASYNLLNGLIEYKNIYPEKVVLLLGNHDFSEWIGDSFICSGYSKFTSSLVKPLFEANKHLFKIAHYENGTIFSHAGFTNTWVKKYLPKIKSPKRIVEKVNNSLLKWQDTEKDSKIFWGLASVGYSRGGYSEPSPLWADATELVTDWFPVPQIVGHTPHTTASFYNKYDRKIWFCDTFSTYPDGIPYGDNSVVEMVGGTSSKFLLTI